MLLHNWVGKQIPKVSKTLRIELLKTISYLLFEKNIHVYNVFWAYDYLTFFLKVPTTLFSFSFI